MINHPTKISSLISNLSLHPFCLYSAFHPSSHVPEMIRDSANSLSAEEIPLRCSCSAAAENIYKSCTYNEQKRKANIQYIHIPVAFLLKRATNSKKAKNCFVCESNTGPSDLQSDALPTELTKLPENSKQDKIHKFHCISSKAKGPKSQTTTTTTNYIHTSWEKNEYASQYYYSE